MTDREARTWEYKLVAVAGGCVVFAVLAFTLFPAALADTPTLVPATAVLGLVGAGFAGLAVLVLVAVWLHHRWFFSAMQRLRRDLGGPAGWLDHHDLRETAGEEAVVAEAESFWRRPHGTVTAAQAGWRLGELISGRWPVRSHSMFAAYPRSVCILGPQGSRKTQFLIPMILDAPGAALVTSSKGELIVDTATLRSMRGAVAFFDPLGVTGGLHDFPFDPVWNCARLTPEGLPDSDYADAIAAAMIRGAMVHKKMNEEFWADAGREILRCFLLAADLEAKGSEKVQQWAHNPDTGEAINILEGRADRVPAGWLSLLRQRLGTNPRMRDGYLATVASCMDYLGHPGGLAAIKRPGSHVRDDIGPFLDARTTLYVVGDKTKRGMSSLMTALTESMVFRAREEAKRRGGRLREPFSLFLDEVANLTPVDLPNYAAETRGWGIFTVAVLQSRAQLDKVWGEDDAKVIWDNLVTKVILGSLGDETFLEALSRLGGERRVTVASDTTRGGVSASHRLERVIPLSVIRSLPANHAYVLGAARHPAVIRFEAGYERLARASTGASRRPVWPRWWREPRRAFVHAFELGRGRRP
ncbi:type IV secretory system conjugative DNA transfer family protein [Actinomycetospora soli]|uniref:type IV secretory system conjugative DNA transfer family protein n=1 Tax=Actinomycetospora soli TaxID=2893887 RepID=UPI001E5E5146|nr:TraM recognition domain-containing protein [Actinomycetospora soli]MCD2191223.1 TraM recognition domain-containing protein [Actinomycetospora soli]